VKVNRPVMPRDKEVILAELQEVRAKLNKAEETIAEETRKKEILESQNQRLNREINSLKEELRLWEGKINNIDEKKLVLERRNRGTKELCQRIWDFKLKAQKEIDQIKMALGNQGYLTKTGKSTFSREKIVKLEKIVVTNQPKDRPANF
jgi:chromosome segregation ATPase